MAVATVSYQLDGVDLHTNNWYLVDTYPVGSNLERRAVNMVIPSRDGVLTPYDDTNEMVQIGLKFVCNAYGGKTAAESYEALVGILSKRWGALILKRTMFGQVTQAQVKLAALVDTDRVETGDSISFTAIMTLPQGWWRDVALADFTLVQPVSGVAYTVTGLENSAGEIRDSLIQFIGPMTNPRLYDANTGQSVLFITTVAAGNRIILNCYTGHASVDVVAQGWNMPAGLGNAVSYMSTYGQQSGRRILGFSPAMVGTDPFNRTVRIQLVYSAGTAASTLKIRAARCFA